MARHFHCAEFEEKTYENQANLELNWGPWRRWPWAYWRYRPRTWSPGQVVENLLGYDAAHYPAAREIWSLLAIHRPPGVLLGDIEAAWYAYALIVEPLPVPRTFRASLFLQYKRPEWYDGLPGGRSSVWDGQPYFRFRLDTTSDQHCRLLDLERVVGRDAAVRYAAPAFHTLAEFEAAHRRGRVIVRSGFLAPSDLLHPHKFWTYQRPGVDGRPNPPDEVARFESWSGLVQAVEAREEVDLALHLARLGDALASSTEFAFDPELGERFDAWSDTLRESAGNELGTALANIARIQTVAHRLGTSWHLLGAVG